MENSKKKRYKEKSLEKRQKNSNFVVVGEITKNILLPILGKEKLLTIELINHWKDIVGKNLAEITLPERIKLKSGNNDEGTLYIRVTGGATATMTQPYSQQIISKINMYLGHQKVKHIRIIQGPFPKYAQKIDYNQRKIYQNKPKNYQQKLPNDIKSEPLRTALSKLGENIKSNNK